MGLREAHEAMKGKIAVVVGGAAGYLGRGTTIGLIKEGVSVICCDNDREGLAAIVPEVEALGGKISAHYADVMDPDSLDAFWDAVAAETDHIDILVNVAGGVARAMFDKTTRETHQKDIRLNYGYHIDSCQRALPLLRKTGNGGSIINFTTIEAHRGAATFAVYAGAKAALKNFSRTLAVEIAQDKIRVNCLASDTTLARASNAALSPEDISRLVELGPDALDKSSEFYVPMKRAPTPEEVVDGVDLPRQRPVTHGHRHDAPRRWRHLRGDGLDRLARRRRLHARTAGGLAEEAARLAASPPQAPAAPSGRSPLPAWRPIAVPLRAPS